MLLVLGHRQQDRELLRNWPTTAKGANLQEERA